MAAQVLLIADRSEAVIQEGQPSAQMAAWLLSIPDTKGNSNALAVAAQFCTDNSFPIGTTARVIDLTVNPLVIQTFTLTGTWVAA